MSIIGYSTVFYQGVPNYHLALQTQHYHHKAPPNNHNKKLPMAQKKTKYISGFYVEACFAEWVTCSISDFSKAADSYVASLLEDLVWFPAYCSPPYLPSFIVWEILMVN